MLVCFNMILDFLVQIDINGLESPLPLVPKKRFIVLFYKSKPIPQSPFIFLALLFLFISPPDFNSMEDLLSHVLFLIIKHHRLFFFQTHLHPTQKLWISIATLTPINMMVKCFNLFQCIYEFKFSFIEYRYF